MDKSENHEGDWLHRELRQGGTVTALLPIMAVVFVAYLVVGLATRDETCSRERHIRALTHQRT